MKRSTRHADLVSGQDALAQHAADAYRLGAAARGLRTEWLGQVFESRYHKSYVMRYRLVGLDMAAPAFPVLVRVQPSNRLTGLPIKAVVEAFTNACLG